MRASTWIHWVCLVQWLVARAEGHGDATCMLQHKAQESLDPAFDCQDGAGIEAFCAKNPKVTAKGVMCTVKCDSDGAVREIVHDAVSLEDASGSTWSVLEPDPEKFQWHYTGYFLKLTVKLDPGEPLCLWRALCSKEEKDGIIEHHKHDATPVTEDDFWTLKFGYLTVPLDYDNTKPSHKITLSLRVSALIGPAGPHAPLILQHNGGPVSDDLDVLYGVLSKKPDLYNTSPTSAMVKAYTVIGIQQRGMSSYAGIGNGRFEPLPVKSKEFLKVCDGKDLTPAPGKSHYDLRDFTSCECNLPEEGVEVPSPFPDPEDEAEMMKWFEFTASRNRNCYNSPYWEMKVSSGGKDYTYNFLDYVGTQMLAMDLDRLREALGAKTLSINGLSYGTAVGAAYAGAFPKSVDKLILNGNVVPGHDVSDYYEYTALASRQGLTKLVQMCWNARYDKTELHKDKIQELCNMDGFDPVEFFMKVVAKVKAEADGATSGSSLYSLPTELNTRFTMTPAMLYQFMNRPISSGTAGQWQNVLEKLSDLGGSNKTRLETATRAVFDEVCANSVTSVGQRDWEVYGYCKEFMNYAKLDFNIDCGLTQNAVRGLDYAGRYTPTGAMSFYKKLRIQYEGVELYWANIKAGALLTWPAQPTPAVLGYRSGVRALIVNSLYDRSTPFAAAQQMRAAFPDGVEMIWQGIGHIVGEGRWDNEGSKSCLQWMDTYLLTGQLPIDGFTCHQTEKLLPSSSLPK